MATSRRNFLTGCSAAIASLAGARFHTLAFGAESGVAEDAETLAVPSIESIDVAVDFSDTPTP